MSGEPDPREPVTEHAIEMSGGGFHVRNSNLRIEKFCPVDLWIEISQQNGSKVYRRRIIVVDDWEEVR